MKLTRSLGQRIFIYSFLLVCVSQVAFLALYIFSIDIEPRRNILAQFCLTVSEALSGKDIEAADILLPIRGLYGRLHLGRPGHGMWVENENGDVLLGQSFPGFSFEDRKNGKLQQLSREGVRIWEAEGYLYLAVYQVPVLFKQGPAYLYNAFFYDKTPPLKNIFYHGCILLVLVGGFFSFWIARRVSWPLRRLGTEVRNLNADQLDTMVTESGDDEVADVAKSINILTKKLNLYLNTRDELIANISHELRSPLARISVILAIMQERLALYSPCSYSHASDGSHCNGVFFTEGHKFRVSEPATFREQETKNQLVEYLNRLHEEYLLMEQLVDTTLLSERLDVQKNLINFRKMDLSAFCTEEYRRNQIVFEQKGISTKFAIEKNLHILGDSSLLQILCSNLFTNAIKYTQTGGWMFFSVKKNTNEIVLRFCNSHPPIAQEKLERFFEPFYRAGIATGNGVGLGLSLVKKICICHNAMVSISNEFLDGKEGVCVQICFPVIQK